VDERHLPKSAAVRPGELVEVGAVEVGEKVLAIGRCGFAVPGGAPTIRRRRNPLGSCLLAQTGEGLHGLAKPRVRAPELVADLVQLPIVLLGGNSVALCRNSVALAGRLIAMLRLLVTLRRHLESHHPGGRSLEGALSALGA
jgi:hypothetical protein